VIIVDYLTLVIASYIIIAIVLIFLVLSLIKKKRISRLKNELEILDREKNEIESAPIISELAKLETIIKNDKIEEKYKSWYDSFENIKNETIPRINDMIIDLDFYMDKKKYKDYVVQVAKTELAIYKAKTATDSLLEEIKEINLSEEKYRKIITKLKTRYRELLGVFEEKKSNYEDVAKIIELQFENIEKRFQDFEEYMEVSDYQEVFHIVKGIDIMIDHMGIVIEEVPDLVLLANRLIPKKIEQITEIYDDMKEKMYPLDHLKIEYNVEESLKNVNQIIDRIKVLNLESCMFELKTMLEYLESLFNEFEYEKKAKRDYEEAREIFDRRLDKLSRIVGDIYLQLDDIKNMYDLTDNDVKIIDEVNSKVVELKNSYDESLKNISDGSIPYSEVSISLQNYLAILNSVENELDIALKNLGNMYEDEVRAREQLDEIQELLKQSKVKIRSYKLPIISNNYFIELQEANEAILEIIKELERKPIAIKTLNTRVDTARDLVLKLFNTTNDMVKTAKLAEYSIVYGNRYRSQDVNIDSGLNQAQMLFYKGNYKKALDVTVSTIQRIDGEIIEKVMDFYEKTS